MTRPAGFNDGFGSRPCPYGYRQAVCTSCGYTRTITGDDDTPECPKCHDGEQICSVKGFFPLPLNFPNHA